MHKHTFHVSDMHCSNCAMKIESLEDELPGVKRVTASYKKAQVMVEFDESLVSIEAIIQGIKKLGYTVIPS